MQAHYSLHALSGTCGFTSLLLHRTLPKYPIFRHFLEIKCMQTTVCVPGAPPCPSSKWKRLGTRLFMVVLLHTEFKTQLLHTGHVIFLQLFYIDSVSEDQQGTKSDNSTCTV